MSNATLLTADRTTHAKIVAVALIASIAVSLIGVAIRVKPVASEPLIQASTHIVVAAGGYTVNPNRADPD
jgi:putative exporter of polyketide antibiotics